MKRFTETTKWDDPWFRKMKPRFKALFEFLNDRCDYAGVWVVDMEIAIAYVGEKIDQKEAIEVFEGRVVDIGNGKWLLPGFISSQYGTLSEKCAPHKRVFEAIRRHSIVVGGDGITRLEDSLSATPSTLPDRVLDTLKEEDKEEDKEEKGGVQGGDQLELPTPEESAEQIYQLYPLKVAKPAAIAAIIKVLKTFPAPELLARTANYARAVSGTDTLIPHPSTWFNQQRFNDSPSTWTRQHANNGQTHQPNGRNAGFAPGASDRARAIAEKARAQTNPKPASDGLAAPVAGNGGHPPAGPGNG